ncbi:MAG TPA: sensor histidine kinase [Usitatibacter sp.]
MANTVDPVTGEPCEPEEHFHPLEIIPFFRRFPRTPARDLLYTFIWSGVLGVAFYLAGALTDGRLPTWNTLAVFFLISNVVGYSIHGLFSLTNALGIDAAIRRRGAVAKVVFFTMIPVAGVMIGLFFASFFIDVGMRKWFMRPEGIVSVLSTSIIISTVLSMVFFLRERHARAEAELQRERARVERVEREAVFANLRALQAQIEPHFLFNTLANVTSLIDPDPAKAKRMLESFIRFLRASLNATRSESTTLADEAELIASYLDVLQIRMGTRLRYEVDVPADLHAVTLPPMLLQPVVENAIRHGLEPKVEGGTVSIRAHRNGAGVAVEIADSGVGFASVTRGGVGLTNLRDRLRLIYGERASLVVADAAQGGAVVTLTLPA